MDTSKLAFDIFDRYGLLKQGLIDHCVTKGSGAWSEEIGLGNLLLIQAMLIDKDKRWLGIGKRLIARTLNEHVRFAFVWPGYLNYGEAAEDFEGKRKPERRAIQRARLAAATAFRRSMGF